MAPRRLAAVLGLLVLVVLASGCIAFEPPSDDDPDVEAVFEGAFVHNDDLEDVSGERVSEVTDGNHTHTSVEQVYERPYVDYRTESLETEGEEEAEIYVSNATVSWWYYPDSEWATYFEDDESFDSDDVRSARAEMADRQLDLYDLEYRGTEQVADREAHVLDVEIKDEAVEEGVSVLVGDTEYVYALETVDPSDELEAVEQTIWIDVEYDYPLKEQLIFEGPDGDRHSWTERFETVTFNSGLEDERFAFEPPENTTVDES
ncbi:DUF2092 domain-containing protein [Natronorubrum sp. JWXQ-INN-674]|uniref:DUF2092 domain-containing protein n=1 Tax=Natronorubrum halalkaliphilum TaxID=2691917 RepID=A0A6B0VRP8_9EURY|nr:DUF2092 domain-containing protein [Natronorubrum halalkaliphilum]MXV64015.1 DUF2092 domain-containing protein [Natronorubrum halalkaliphilum]